MPFKITARRGRGRTVRRRGGKPKIVRLSMKAMNKKIRRKGRSKKSNITRRTNAGIPQTHAYRRGVRKTTQRGSYSRTTVSGSYFLGPLALTTSNTVGQVVFNKLLAPQSFTSCRLQLYAKMYEKYKFSNLTIEYRPTCPTTTQGQVVGFIDVDVDDTDPTGNNGVNAAISVPGCQEHALYTSALYKMVHKKPYPAYWCDNPSSSHDADQVYMGQLKVICSGVPTSNITAGNLTMHYTCTFWDPHENWSTISINAAGYDSNLLANYNNSSNMFGAPVMSTQNSFQLSVAGNVLTIQGVATGGTYMLAIELYVGSSGTLTTPPGITIAGATQVTVNSVTSTTKFLYSGQVTVTSSPFTATMAGANMTMASGAYLQIELYPNAFKFNGSFASENTISNRNTLVDRRIEKLESLLRRLTTGEYGSFINEENNNNNDSDEPVEEEEEPPKRKKARKKGDVFSSDSTPNKSGTRTPMG